MNNTPTTARTGIERTESFPTFQSFQTVLPVRPRVDDWNTWNRWTFWNRLRLTFVRVIRHRQETVDHSSPTPRGALSSDSPVSRLGK